MTDQTNAAGGTPGVDAGNNPPVTPPSNQPDYKALYEELKAKQAPATPAAPVKGDENDPWFKRAVGFQQSAQEEAKARRELEEKFKLKETEYSTLDALFKTKEQELDTLKQKETELEVVQGSLERLNIIASEFPDLLKFLGKDEDLLPDGRGDDLRSKLTSFQTKLGIAAAPAASKKDPTGATPPPPGGAGGETYASNMQEALNALSRGDQTAYDMFYQKAISASR